MIIGWIGVVLLLVAYITVLVKARELYFWTVNALASIILTIYAFLIKDYVFVCVNGFISIVAFRKSIMVRKNGT